MNPLNRARTSRVQSILDVQCRISCRYEYQSFLQANKRRMDERWENEVDIAEIG